MPTPASGFPGVCLKILVPRKLRNLQHYNMPRNYKKKTNRREWLQDHYDQAIMISLLLHTTHRMQPLEIALYRPLKTYYGQACDRFMVNNPGKVITDRTIGHIFGEAYLKAATLEIAINRFQRTGIESYNPDIFSDIDFEPACVSERPLSPWQIRALPKYDRPTSNTRKKQKCSILTSTPVKEQLEQQEKEHGENERKKQERKEICNEFCEAYLTIG
ncbi:hypothetical protein QE152_g30598 [Popillia japonica]|uniref:Uncharacterized protein n=1 Tax=Popillia japonica TaxID=7064 RepID=A0AAW1JEJ4_POPJA